MFSYLVCPFIVNIPIGVDRGGNVLTHRIRIVLFLWLCWPIHVLTYIKWQDINVNTNIKFLFELAYTYKKFYNTGMYVTYK